MAREIVVIYYYYVHRSIFIKRGERRIVYLYFKHHVHRGVNVLPALCTSTILTCDLDRDLLRHDGADRVPGVALVLSRVLPLYGLDPVEVLGAEVPGEEGAVLHPAVLGLRIAQGLALQDLGAALGHHRAEGRGGRGEARGLEGRATACNDKRAADKVCS